MSLNDVPYFRPVSNSSHEHPDLNGGGRPNGDHPTDVVDSRPRHTARQALAGGTRPTSSTPTPPVARSTARPGGPPGNSAVPAVFGGWRSTLVDWAHVRDLRARAADRLATALQDRPGLGHHAQQELGRAIISDVLTLWEGERLDLGTTLSVTDRTALATAVFDALFRLGRLQALVDDPALENIEVRGHDGVHLLYADGRVEAGPPVADSDEDLLADISFLATRNERLFSPAHPQLDLRLPDGSRLAASGWGITARPLVVIRRHRLSNIDLDGLVDRAMLPAELAHFLTDAVRRRRSIVVSGPQGGGKTTLARALAGCIDPRESIGTIETEFELALDPVRHPRTCAWEARPGSSERGADGANIGAVTLDELLRSSLRYNLDRVIVGEVRGPEVLPMFKAMQAGAGSLSTTHAHSARAAIERLVTCAMEAGSHVTEAFAYRQIAAHIHLIVQVGWLPSDQGRRRVITEVIAVTPGEEGRPAITDLYRIDPSGVAHLLVPPHWAGTEHDPTTITTTHSGYQSPPDQNPTEPERSHARAADWVRGGAPI